VETSGIGNESAAFFFLLEIDTNGHIGQLQMMIYNNDLSIMYAHDVEQFLLRVSVGKSLILR